MQLQKLKICHQDLSYGNIMYKDGKFYMVDFGYLVPLMTPKSFKKTSKSNDGSLYDPYPWLYFLFGNKNKKRN